MKSKKIVISTLLIIPFVYIGAQNVGMHQLASEFPVDIQQPAGIILEGQPIHRKG